MVEVKLLLIITGISWLKTTKMFLFWKLNLLEIIWLQELIWWGCISHLLRNRLWFLIILFIVKVLLPSINWVVDGKFNNLWLIRVMWLMLEVWWDIRVLSKNRQLLICGWLIEWLRKMTWIWERPSWKKGIHRLIKVCHQENHLEI